MASLKQVIYNALVKCSTPEHGVVPAEFESAEAARDAFIALVMAELFPEEEVTVPVVVDNTPETLPERVAKRKLTKEEKEAEKKAKAEAKEAEKKAKEEAKEAEKKAKAEAKEAEKKAKEEAKAAKKAASPKKVKEADGGEAAPASPKKKAAKKEKPAADANLPKMDPTWRKHLKKADKDHAKELEPQLLAYLNAMTKEDFNSKSAEEHVAAFLTKPLDDGKVEADLVVVEFKGKEYFINPETKRVYEGEGVQDAEGNWANYKGVGYVGMAAFAEMTLDV